MLVLKLLAAENSLYFSPVYCSFPVYYIPFSVYMMTTLHSCTLHHVQSIYIAALPFLIN